MSYSVGAMLDNTIRPYSDEKTFQRRVGIEIEAENPYGYPSHGYPSIENYWNPTDDGSLRAGVEYVSRVLGYKETDKAIDAFYSTVDDLCLLPSVRTGIHVHVDVRDLNFQNLVCVAVMFILCEPLLFRVAGEGRDECIYCIPWYRGDDSVARLLQTMRNFKETDKINIDGEQYTFSESNKYSSFYMAPVTSLGTVEFRMAPTFTHPGRLKEWVAACRNIVGYGAQAETAMDLVNLFEDMGPRTFYQTHLPMLPIPDDIEKAVYTAEVQTLAERLARGWKTDSDVPKESEWMVRLDDDFGEIPYHPPPLPPRHEEDKLMDLKKFRRIPYEDVMGDALNTYSSGNITSNSTSNFVVYDDFETTSEGDN